MSFLHHDMTPIDPLELRQKRGVPREPVITPPIYATTRAPRPKQESILTTTPNGRLTAINHFAPGGIYVDGKPRENAVPATAPASFMPIDIPNGPTSVLMGVSPATNRGRLYSASDPSDIGHSGYKKVDLHGEVSPARAAYLEKIRADLQTHEIRQKHEREERMRQEYDSKRQANGWVMEKPYTQQGERSGKIPQMVSNSQKYGTEKSQSYVPPARHAHQLEEHHRATEEDRKMLGDIAAQMRERDMRRREEHDQLYSPDAGIVNVIHDKHAKPQPRISREHTAIHPNDYRQLSREYKQAHQEDREKLKATLLHQMQTREDPLEGYSSFKPVLGADGKYAPLPRAKDPENTRGGNDGGRIDGFYDALTKNAEYIGDKLGKVRGSNRVHRPPDEEDTERKRVQEERKAMLDSLRQEREELQAKLRQDEQNLLQMEMTNYPLYKKSRVPPAKFKSSLGKEDGTSDDVKHMREQQRSEYRDIISQQKQQAQESRIQSAVEERQRDSEALSQDPWHWNNDLMKKQVHRTEEPSNDVMEYRRQLSQQNEQRRTQEMQLKQERLRDEMSHLDNSLDVRFIKTHQEQKNRPTVLPSLQKQIFITDPLDDPERMKRDHVKQQLEQWK